MDEHIMGNFQFVDYKLEDMSMVLNPNYDDQDYLEQNLSVTVSIEISFKNDLEQARVRLKFGVFEGVEDEKYPYKINVTMVGYFQLPANISEEKATEMCKLNGTAIMFPYIRSAITDLTKVSNVNPLILPTVNIYNLIKNQEKK